MASRPAASTLKQTVFGCLLFGAAMVIGLYSGRLVFNREPMAGSSKGISLGSGRYYVKHAHLDREDVIPDNKYISESRTQPRETAHETTRDKTSSHQAYKIPNIVHYIFPAKSARPLEFTEYISILSVYQYQDPVQIWIHCHQDPYGRWWDQLMLNISFHKLRILDLKLSNEIIGRDSSSTNKEHAIEVARLEILLRYGGIYLDSDVILIQSLDPLRHHPAVLGQESDFKLSTAVVMATANSSFLQLMLDSYHRDVRPKHLEYNSGYLPYKFAQKFPDLVRIDPTNLVAPPLSQKQLLYTDNTELLQWRQLYTVHLMFHDGTNRVYNPEYIRPLKNLVGRLLRRVYYGSDADPDPYLHHVQEREKYGLANSIADS